MLRSSIIIVHDSRVGFHSLFLTRFGSRDKCQGHEFHSCRQSRQEILPCCRRLARSVSGARIKELADRAFIVLPFAPQKVRGTRLRREGQNGGLMAGAPGHFDCGVVSDARCRVQLIRHFHASIETKLASGSASSGNCWSLAGDAR
jgi:hypothetical protein